MGKSPSSANSLKPPTVSAWTKFLTAHPAPFSGLFAFNTTKLPKGLSPSKLVRQSLKDLAVGKWETLTLRQNGASLVFVAFANQTDFDNVKAHFKGQPWKSTVQGAVDGFSVTWQ